VLSYEKTNYNLKTTKVTIKVDYSWGMFSGVGNLLLAGHAKSLYGWAEKYQNRKIDSIKMLQKFKDYFIKYRKATYNIKYSEAGDTAVRENVWGFACIVGEAVGFDKRTLDPLWEEAEREVYAARKALKNSKK